MSGWPVRCGTVPPLAARFSTRPESAPDLSKALERGAAVALTPRSRRLGAKSSYDWLRCSGKTQLAASYAESQSKARALDLLVWIDGSSTASILSGYVAAAQALTGTLIPGIAESVAASFLGWLTETDRRWLIVLDDVPESSLLRGLWPAGSSGRVVVTTPSTQALVDLPDVLALELGPFSKREAMSYLVGRLSSDPDQRRGAIDLLDDLECQPLALAAVMRMPTTAITSMTAPTAVPIPMKAQVLVEVEPKTASTEGPSSRILATVPMMYATTISHPVRKPRYGLMARPTHSNDAPQFAFHMLQRR